MDEKFYNDRTKLKNILNAIYIDNKKGIEIAKDYNVSTAYVSQLKTKLNQVEFELVVKDNSLVCSKCQNDGLLEFHHDHETGEIIALVCNSCNKKIGKNHWEYESYEIKSLRHKTFFYRNKQEILTKILKMIDDGFLVVDPKKIKNREDDIKWLESLS